MFSFMWLPLVHYGKMCEVGSESLTKQFLRLRKGWALVATRTTLARVARHAGVSIGTASKVLNGRAGVGEETRQRVQAAVVELGYHPTTARADDVATGVRRVSALFTSVDGNTYVPQSLNALLVAAPAHQIEITPRLFAPRTQC